MVCVFGFIIIIMTLVFYHYHDVFGFYHYYGEFGFCHYYGWIWILSLLWLILVRMEHDSFLLFEKRLERNLIIGLWRKE